MSSRRDFIKRAALAGIVSSILPVSSFSKPKLSVKSHRVLRIAHITDVHLIDQPNAVTFFPRVMQEINSMSDKPDLIINTGDSVMEMNKQTYDVAQKHWNIWNQIVKAENHIPIKSVLGNHDVWTGPNPTLDAEYKKQKQYGKQWAIEMLSMPSRYYSFEKNGWYFIALDSINGENGYQLDEEQIEWLKIQLSKIPETNPVCVFNHVPILSMAALMQQTKNYPAHEVRWPWGNMHNDHQSIKNIFLNHKNVKLCLSGHIHYVDLLEYLGVTYMCNGAISGNWWKNPLSCDEFPPVYTILDLYSDGTIHHQHIYYNTTL